MEKSVAVLLTEPIVVRCADRFGGDAGSQTLVSDVENFVFEVTREGEPFILRITHTSHRSAAELRSELDFMGYLSAHGIPAPDPIPSATGELVEEVEANGTRFLATAFSRLPGDSILDAGAGHPRTYRRWGRLMGRMHALAQAYTPSRGTETRPSWDENDLVVNAPLYLAGQADVLARRDRLLADLHGLATDAGAYGLIHADLTDVNLLVHEGRLHVIDFDDAEYHWFAYDLAVVLFDSLPYMPREGMDAQRFARRFWADFNGGYTEENRLDRKWLRRVPLFMKLREMTQYTFMHKKWDLEDLSDARRERLASFRASILCGRQRLDLDL